MHRLTLRQTARVIAVSEAVAAGLRAQKIFPPEKVITIHNGIDIERFMRGREAAPPPRRDAPMRVGTIGHLAPIKGQEDFVRAAAIICKQRHDVEFVIAGEDKSAGGENRARIEKLIRDLDLDGRIQMLGWVDDVGPLLATWDLFISPALSEPFGLSIVEAMAASVVVVATFSEGAREIVEDNQTGRLVPVGDVTSMAAAMSELLADRLERDRLARNALVMARTKFSLEAMVERTEQVYRNVLAEGSG
jgi:glycosyltransferase involved in cell wall biosynthesis